MLNVAEENCRGRDEPTDTECQTKEGHEYRPGDRDSYRDWVLATTEEIWAMFRAKFLDLWRSHPSGDAYPAPLFEGTIGAMKLATGREVYMDRLFQDTIGFAAAKMIRRILGLAHNIDFEWIKDAHVRATCEARALRLARDLMVNAERYRTIRAVTDAARNLRGLKSF